ncbi:MAG: hypothetical protein JW974_01570 [Alphaproteobacteria bacterium]|nr:hypothetical protein [Alphaproteobacteria bacterium]MBN2675470.1 hypothetical protein [Alphaproteobacteria bacterium]
MKKTEETIDTGAEATVEIVEIVEKAGKAEKVVKKSAGKTVSVELTEEQYAFLTGWQKTHENELGIEVPIGALVRKAVDVAMKVQNKPEFSPRPTSDRDGDRPRPNFGGSRDSRGGDRPRPSFGGSRDSRGGDRPRPSFGGSRDSRGGDRPSFGSRPSFRSSEGRGGPKFGGFNDKRNTVKKFSED